MSEKKSFLEKLQHRWGLKSIFQVIMVLIVFACTGLTVLFLKNTILQFFGIENTGGWYYTVLYLIIVLPLYQLFLLVYAFIFGQFKFFWAYEKRFFDRIFGRKK